MAVQPPLPNIKTSGGQSPLKISPTKAATLATPVPPKQSTPLTAGAGTPQPNSLSSTMPAAPRSKKWLWILLGFFGILIVLAIGIGLYLWLT